MQPTHRPPNPERTLRVFDTTLRDGLQGRGLNTTLDDELAIAAALLRTRVDTMEAGCPSSNEQEMQRVKEVVQMAQDTRTKVAAFCMCRESTIRAAQEALENASDHGVLSLLTSVSRYRLRNLFGEGKAYARATELFTRHTRMAAEDDRDVHVYLEDATRANRRFLFDLIPALCEAGATTISVPDTTGAVNDPTWYGNLIAQIREHTPAGVDVSAHTHNDLSLAVANALSAVHAGASQVETTLYGFGERIGNLDMAQVLYALSCGPQKYHVTTNVHGPSVGKAMRVFRERTGFEPHRKAPLYGGDMFKTKAGIHQSGMRQDVRTYCAHDPRFLGLPGPEDVIVFGPGSGKNAIVDALALEDVHVERKDSRLDGVASDALTLARSTTDGELPSRVLAALAQNTLGDGGPLVFTKPPHYEGEGENQYIRLALRDVRSGQEHTVEQRGGGGLIALACRGLSALTGITLHIGDHDWHSENIGEGEDSPEFIVARMRNGRRHFEGLGLDKDSTLAGFSAVLRGFNRAARWKQSQTVQGAREQV